MDIWVCQAQLKDLGDIEAGLINMSSEATCPISPSSGICVMNPYVMFYIPFSFHPTMCPYIHPFFHPNRFSEASQNPVLFLILKAYFPLVLCSLLLSLPLNEYSFLPLCVSIRTFLSFLFSVLGVFHSFRLQWQNGKEGEDLGGHSLPLIHYVPDTLPAWKETPQKCTHER